jgi:hypothetical protein
MNSRELYRGYIRETIIKPGLNSTSQSNIVDHVSSLIEINSFCFLIFILIFLAIKFCTG